MRWKRFVYRCKKWSSCTFKNVILFAYVSHAIFDASVRVVNINSSSNMSLSKSLYVYMASVFGVQWWGDTSWAGYNKKRSMVETMQSARNYTIIMWSRTIFFTDFFSSPYTVGDSTNRRVVHSTFLSEKTVWHIVLFAVSHPKSHETEVGRGK